MSKKDWKELVVFSCPRCRDQLLRRTSQSSSNPGRDFFAHLHTQAAATANNNSKSKCHFFQWVDQITPEQARRSQTYLVEAENREWTCIKRQREMDDVLIVQRQLQATSNTPLEKTIKVIAPFLNAYELIATGLTNRRCRNTLLETARYLPPEVCSIWKTVEKRIAAEIVRRQGIHHSPVLAGHFGAVGNKHQSSIHSLRRHDVLVSVKDTLAGDVFSLFSEAGKHHPAQCDLCTIRWASEQTHGCVFVHHHMDYRGYVSLRVPRVCDETQDRKTDLVSVEHLDAFARWCEFRCLHHDGVLQAFDYDVGQEARRAIKVRAFVKSFAQTGYTYWKQPILRMVRAWRIESQPATQSEQDEEWS